MKFLLDTPSAVKPQSLSHEIVFWDKRILAQNCKKRWAIAYISMVHFWRSTASQIRERQNTRI